MATLRSSNPRVNEFTRLASAPAKCGTPDRVTSTITTTAKAAAKNRSVRTAKWYPTKPSNTQAITNTAHTSHEFMPPLPTQASLAPHGQFWSYG